MSTTLTSGLKVIQDSDPAGQDIENENIVILDAFLNNYLKQGITAITDVAGTSLAYTITPAPALSAYATGLRLTVFFDKANIGAVTVNISGKGAKALKKQDGSDYAAGELAINTPYTFVYNGTSFLADSSGGLADFYGDGSDGAYVASYSAPVPTFTAPNGGTIANLTDGNYSVNFTTNSVTMADPPVADNSVVFKVDFGKVVELTSWTLQNIKGLINYTNLRPQYSLDGTTWYNYYDPAMTGGYFSYILCNTTITSPTSTQVVRCRYWRLYNLTISGCNATTIQLGEFTYTVTANLILLPLVNEIAMLQCTSFTLPAGLTLATPPSGGLIIYSTGNVTITGALDMSKKAGYGVNGNIVPMVITKKNSSAVVTVDKYLKLSTVLQSLRGGAGGNGGNGGRYTTDAFGAGGIGGLGRQNLGGFGGGGGGGNSYQQKGGSGGTIEAADMGGGENRNMLTCEGGASSIRNWPGISGSNGAGGIGAVSIQNTAYSVIAGKGGKCFGGGGGGSAGMRGDSASAGNTGNDGGDGSYAGGFILIIAKGTITIDASGSIKANGGNGGNGVSASKTDCSGGGGGGGAGGGVIALPYKTGYINNGTVQATGGTGGSAGNGSGTVYGHGGAGTSGAAGTIVTQQL